MHLCREFVFTCKCMCVCVPVCACACVLKICIINIFMALLQFDSLYVHFQLFSLVLYLLRFLTLSVSLPLALSVSFWMQVQLLCAEKRLHFDRRHLHWPNWSPKCWSSSALSLSSPFRPLLLLHCVGEFHFEFKPQSESESTVNCSQLQLFLLQL